MVLLNYAIGRYMIQAISHSLIVAMVVEALIRVWQIRKPSLRLQFRLLIVAFPVLVLPFYQLAYPQRGSEGFRESLALFDGDKWLTLHLGSRISLGDLAILFMALVTTVFIVQEVIPLARRGFYRKKSHRLLKGIESPQLEAALVEVAGTMGCPVPPVFLLDSQEPIIHITGLARPFLILSRPLIDMLDFDELKGALAHEVAHIIRKDHWKGGALMFLRALMFFNPVVLVAFRRIIHENEKACDDVAVSVTGNSLAYVSGLIKVFRATEARRSPSKEKKGWFSSVTDSLDMHARRICIEDRVERILHSGLDPAVPYGGIRMGLTIVALAVLLFFVV